MVSIKYRIGSGGSRPAVHCSLVRKRCVEQKQFLLTEVYLYYFV